LTIHSVYSFFQSRFRSRRMRQFEHTFSQTRGSRVLDIGGTPSIWQFVHGDYTVTLLNLEDGPCESEPDPPMDYVCGSALALPFPDNCFDIAFSNSVIEHVGDFSAQELFAEEARRVAPRVWVQTPSRWFPVEPHYMALGIHYLPRGAQRWLLRYFSVWGWVAKPSMQYVDATVGSIRLLSKREMKRLFPDCRIVTERFLLLAKAYIAIR